MTEFNEPTETLTNYPPLVKWDDIDSSKPNVINILRGIYAYGFEDPSNIQQQFFLYEA